MTDDWNSQLSSAYTRQGLTYGDVARTCSVGTEGSPSVFCLVSETQAHRKAKTSRGEFIRLSITPSSDLNFTYIGTLVQNTHLDVIGCNEDVGCGNDLTDGLSRGAETRD